MWFLKRLVGGEEEKTFTELFMKESRLACESVRKLAELLTLAIDGKDVKKLADEINRLERMVDEARKEAEDEIYKGAFLPFTRADRLELLEDVDTIADIAEETAILLRMKKVRAKGLRGPTKELSISLARTMDALAALLEAMASDMDDFLKVYEILRERRRDTRGKIYAIYDKLFRSRPVSTIDVEILLETLRKIMVMCRKINDVADRARAMVIKYL